MEVVTVASEISAVDFSREDRSANIWLDFCSSNVIPLPFPYRARELGLGVAEILVQHRERAYKLNYVCYYSRFLCSSFLYFSCSSFVFVSVD